MKTTASILALLATSAVFALPRGDKKRAVPSDEETQQLKQAIEILSYYEYGNNPGQPWPPTKPPKGTGGIKAPPKIQPDISQPAELYPVDHIQPVDKRGLDDKESLRIAIEWLSKYEYGPKHPDIPGPYFPTPDPELQYVKKKKRSPLKKEEEYQIQQAIEILSDYEYGQPGPKKPFPYKNYPHENIPKIKRAPLKKEEEYQIQQAIELLSSYEYGQPGPNGPIKSFPVKSGPYFPQGPEIQYVPKTKRSPLKKEDELELQQAIELLSYYEYGNPGPGPIKPYPGKPKYPHKPDIYIPETDSQIQDIPKTKRSPLRIDEQYEIQQAIEILSQYEYSQPQPQVLPIKPLPVKSYPYDQPKKGGIIPRSVPEIDKESLIAAIELLNKYEYKDKTHLPIRPPHKIEPYPVDTLVPAPVSNYDPTPIKNPGIAKIFGRKIEEKKYTDAEIEEALRAAIELLSRFHYDQLGPVEGGSGETTPVFKPDVEKEPAKDKSE